MSVAPMGRRLLALIVDWLLCALIASSLTGHVLFGSAADHHYFAAQYGTLGLFVLEVYLLTAISGLTVGKRLLGLRTIRTDGSRPGFGWAALRTLLLVCVIPACLSDRDLRGLHDRAADTIVVRLLSPLASARSEALWLAGKSGRASFSAAWASAAGGHPWGSAPSASASSAAAPAAGR